MDQQRSFIVQKLSECFAIQPETAETSLSLYAIDIDHFLNSTAPQALIWSLQPGTSNSPELRTAATNIGAQPLHAKALVLMHNGSMSTKHGPTASTISCLEIPPSLAHLSQTIINDVLRSEFVETEEQSIRQDRICTGREIPTPQGLKELSTIKTGIVTTNAALHSSAMNSSWRLWTSEFEDCCRRADDHQRTQSTAANGLAAELQWWIEHCGTLKKLEDGLAKINATHQSAAKTMADFDSAKRLSQARIRLTGELQSAQERVGILRTLSPVLQCFECADLCETLAALPHAFDEVRVAVAASKVYSRVENLLGLLSILAARLEARSRQAVDARGLLWEQPKSALLDVFVSVTELHAVFVHRSREFLLTLPCVEGQSCDIDTALNARFSTYTRVSSRCQKLHKLFTAAERFHGLSKLPYIPELAEISKAFDAQVQNALAAGTATAAGVLNAGAYEDFEKDMLEFAVHCNDLELRVQELLETSFESAVSTQHALRLLRQYSSLLPSDIVESFTDTAYLSAFRRFALDIEKVQYLYEKHKTNPPRPRGAPPTAGAVAWARSLLHRIEQPMREFSSHQALVASKYSRKIVKAYNRLAQTLLEFEGLWHAAWIRKAEAALAGLQLPVLLQHPKTGELHVNLDVSVPRLIQEGCWLGRMGLAVPESIRQMSLVADRVYTHHAGLTKALNALEGAQSSAPSAVRPLLKQIAQGLVRGAGPGRSSVLWVSATLDEFVHTFVAAVGRYTQVAHRIVDMHRNRVEAVVQTISGTKLLDLSAKEPIGCAEFLQAQDRHLATAQATLVLKDKEARSGCEDLIRIVTNEAQGPESGEVHSACNAYRKHCWGLVRAAAVHAATQSFCILNLVLNDAVTAPRPAAIEDLIFVPHSRGSLPKVVLELRFDVPAVQIHPSLDDIQTSFASCTERIAAVVDALPEWSRGFKDSQQQRFQRLSDKVALGISEDARTSIDTHLTSFKGFEFLRHSSDDEKPANSSAERDLLHELATLQTELDSIPSLFHVKGSTLCLATSPLKRAIQSELVSWRIKCGGRLHAAAGLELRALAASTRDISTRLSRKIEDLHDAQAVMSALADAREAELSHERAASAIEEKYAELKRYGVPILTEELDALDDLRLMRKSMVSGMGVASDSLEKVQSRLVTEVTTSASMLAFESATLRASWESSGPMLPDLSASQAESRLAMFKSDLEKCRPAWERVTLGETLFGLPPTQLEGLRKLQEDISIVEQLYTLYGTVLRAEREYGQLSWVQAVGAFEAVEQKYMEFQASVKRVPKALREFTAFKEVRQKVDSVAGIIPVLSGLAHGAVTARHWKDVGTLLSVSLPLPAEGLTLGHILDVASLILEKKADVEDLCSSAVKEDAAERKFKAVENQWASEVLTFTEFKQRGNVVLHSTETAELMERLEDSSMVLGNLAASRYATPIRTQVQALAGKLGAVIETMERWLAVQSMWTYMETIFCGGDIARQLPAEAKRFQGIDRTFLKVVTGAREAGTVLEVCAGSDAFQNALSHLLEQLELCQKGLADYLESKRAEFPRFYFVSDPTLLEILSLGSDPTAVVPHFQSGLFDSLANVTFDPNDKYKITEMWSREGELVPLSQPVDARGPVEVWLQRLVTEMQSTVRDLIREAAYDAADAVESGKMPDLEKFVFGRPAQAALVGLQLWWTGDMTAALKAAAREEKGALTRALRRTEVILSGLVDLALRPDLTKLQRTSLETCITVYVHQKEATEDLVRKKVRDPRDFEWMKQCRIIWREDRDTLMVSICDVDLEYSYEYLGVKERLVVTPLTDVCYITLTQAMGMYLGGAPAGPAGTGKTETTKDLGATLGKYVVVFNCSDQMDHKGLGKIFKGLAQSGLWGCFDEFNRINLDVLSVCAQQVNCVLGAVRERRKSFIFTDGTTVPLDPRVGIFITMNPGYAGRQELPENLKALFRGVTMMVPNRQIIMKVKLAAAGFQENEILAKKFNVLYALCEQQLSKQPHYDFGLRNILSVLRSAGTSKRGKRDMDESELMMRTLRDINMSKLVAEDVPLFLSLIEDVFPRRQIEKATQTDVSSALERVCRERGLEAHGPWIEKCLQLYENTVIRHGIMVVGPPGSGKSTAIECLAAALSEVGQKTVVWRMHPKAITAPQMFGRMDAATGDWTDGIFATLWRRAARANKNQNTWIVLDGPVDAVWIENLNTVLDDNKLLTLANGDRVAMTPQMRLIFEVENLNNASPATVSRAGIIYMSNSELGWTPLTKAWLKTRAEAEAAVLGPLFDRFVGPVLEFIRLQCQLVVPSEEACLVKTMCTLLGGVLDQQSDRMTDGKLEQTAINTAPSEDSTRSYEERRNSGAGPYTLTATSAVHERHFLFCIAWALGGLLQPKDREALDTYLRSVSSEMPACKQPGESVFDYLVNAETGEWIRWATQVPKWQFPQSDARFSQMIVPMVESVRLEWLISLVHGAGASTLLIGGPGTAKTTIAQQFLSRRDIDTHATKIFTFSSVTTPAIFQESLENAVEKRQGRVYGPPSGKSATFFLDDLAMPTVNQWGDQVTNELVRQVIEHRGWYSTDKPVGEWKALADVKFVAAMALPSSGRNDIPNRLKRHFCAFYVPPPSDSFIKDVFGQIMAGHFAPARSKLHDVAQRLVPATLAVWNSVHTKLLPTPAKFHYLFTVRDISRVFHGVMLATIRQDPGEVSSREAEWTLVALWAHECKRVFADKLICDEDKDVVDRAVTEAAMLHLPPALATAAGEQQPLFADFLRDAPVDETTGEPTGPRPSCYELVPGGMAHVRQRVEALIERAKTQGRGDSLPDLVLFDDALRHVLRVSRILAMDRGSALLVGIGGSGKQSSARLAAHLAGATCFKFTLTKTYGVGNFLEDLKTLYKLAFFKPQPVAFLITEADIKEEAFLEYINQVLMTGEVAGLFPKDELDAVLGDVRPVMRASLPGLPDTRENLYSFFINRVRDRLHIVLCLSPVGPRFARWAIQFPGLINGCTIDWFVPWPEEALLSVSSRVLARVPELAVASLTQRQALEQLMAWVHTRVIAACQTYYVQYRRQVHVTPKSYIAALEAFRSLYISKLAYIKEARARLATGLSKMNTAKEDVGKMRIELAAKEVQLGVAGEEAHRLLSEISENTAMAEKERVKVAKIVEAVREKAAEIAAVKADAQRDLAEAQPVLDAALAALNSITPKDIVSLKALKSPPDVVKRIFDCVLLLRHFPVNRIAWHDVKGAQVIVGSYDGAVRMMGEMNFLQSLLNFPKESINDETVELLQPYFRAPDFNFESAKKASGNVAGLCNWAAAMCKYHEVAKVVEPKIISLQLAEAELRAVEEERAAAECELATVQAKLDAMQAKLDAAVAAKAALENDAAATTRKMDNAATLLGALGGEESRWVEQVAQLQAAEEQLVGDCALACAFLSYLGPFNRAFREKMMEYIATACSRRGFALTNGMDVAKFLATESEIAVWGVEGLPSDTLSIQNGVLVTRATRYPLLIDPQGQGKAWLARHLGSALMVTTFADKQFRSILEESISSGRPLLIENVEEELDPVLDVLLEKKANERGETRRASVVMLGETEVAVADGFCLYLTCRLPNPRLAPETFAKLIVIDFTVTPSGLEDQLLGVLVLKEKKDLEERGRKLVEDVASYRCRVAQLESDLLKRLSTSSVNLLEDAQLVEVLALTKSTALEVAAKIATAAEARVAINAACEEYRPAAHRAMLLYFLMVDFGGVNTMYQTSLAQFTALYEASIDEAARPLTPAHRALAIVDHFTAAFFEYTQRGLFERHKPIFAFLMAVRVGISGGQVDGTELATFLKLGSGVEASSSSSLSKKPKEWVSGGVWRNVVYLAEKLPIVFGDLPDALALNDQAWKLWSDAEAPESAEMPIITKDKAMSPFQRLCLIRAFREDRTLMAAAAFVSDSLGRGYVEPPTPTLEAIWGISRAHCPIVCILSPGADPTKSIEELSKRKKIKCHSISMGQGQEVVARRLVASAAADGNWVLVQNAHLGLHYLAELERWIVKMDTVPNDAFRIWITTEPHPKFPMGLLHASLKLSVEPPRGVRAGLRASYAWVTQEFLDAVPRSEWRQLLFALCFLHAIVQERRQFGPIGWNVPYEFNGSDLVACAQFLQNHIQDMVARRAQRPDWATVRYMIGTIQYGGRITDDHDRMLMEAYVEQFFRDEVLASNYAIFAEKGPKAGRYYIPDATDIGAFRDAIEAFPLRDHPELFGLHANAELGSRLLQVAEAMMVVENTMPKTDNGHEGSNVKTIEAVVDELAHSLEDKLPSAFGPEDIKGALGRLAGGPTAPLNIHLRQEIDRLNKVVRTVKESLRTLRLAIAGSIAMGDDIASNLDALFGGKVPAPWAKISWESPTVGAWVDGLLRRHDQLSKWLTTGRPKSFWLSGFFNPQGFLTAVKQEVTRRHAGDHWALDDVVLVSQVLRTVDPGSLREGAQPGEGVYVHGLYLDGCSWGGKEGKLVDPEPKKLFAPLPVLHITAVHPKDKARSGYFEAPCYRVKRRTGANYIASFMLRSDQERGKWVRRGVALLCSVD